jgi:hypothetical protein
MSETPDFVVHDRDPRDNAIPRFYLNPIQNNFKSQEQGRPIFDEVEFVEILIPGDRNARFDGRVKDEHRQRWPREYAAFKAGLETPAEGTPIREWAAITRGQAEELAFANVRTVEVLASLSDQQLQKVVPMNGYALREKAQRALEQAAGSEPAEKLAAEVENLKATIAQMKSTIEAQAAELAKRGSDQT